jgi:hypothetical protein
MKNDNIYEAIQRSGAKMLILPLAPVTGASPGEIEQSEHFLSESQNAFAEAATHGLTVVPGLGAYAFPKPNSALRKTWIDFAAEMVNKYGPGTSSNLKYWQIWNEPNMEFKTTKDTQGGEPKPGEFARFFKEMAEAMRKASKEVKILSPSLYGYRSYGCAPACHQGAHEFLENMDTELKNLNYDGKEQGYDAISLHPYVFELGRRGHKHAPMDANEVKKVKEEIQSKIKEIHNLHVNRPIWVTELGFPVDNPAMTAHVPPVTPSIQRALVKSTFVMLQNNSDPKRLNIAHAFYYNIQDAPSVGNGWEYHAGLLDADPAKPPRPAWGAYSDLAGGQHCPFASKPEC